MRDTIKIKVASFVADILENDALRFGFMKNQKSNKNALLNKLIPTLVEVRKTRRNEIENILKTEYRREDGEHIYSAVNTVIDKVYFNGEELDTLDEYIWIRPSKETISCYDEIETSETLITVQEMPVYIRGLLNEYSRLPQYKREMLAFDKEMDIFDAACEARRIIHFRDRDTNERCKAFAFNYVYGYLYDQTNYCIIYDIHHQMIRSIPLHRIQDVYMIKQKFKPSERLSTELQAYFDSRCFEKELYVEGEENVF